MINNVGEIIHFVKLTVSLRKSHVNYLKIKHFFLLINTNKTVSEIVNKPWLHCRCNFSFGFQIWLLVNVQHHFDRNLSYQRSKCKVVSYFL